MSDRVDLARPIFYVEYEGPTATENGVETLLAAGAKLERVSAPTARWCKTHKSKIPDDWAWCETADAESQSGACLQESIVALVPVETQGGNIMEETE